MSTRDEREAFEEAMRGVDRLPPSRRLAKRSRRRGRAAESEGERPVRFTISRWGEHRQGIARGVDDVELRRLEEGEYSPELRLDLHGVAEEDARGLVRDLLRRALKARLRCVVVVHGRGLRSPDGPVLKRALPDWLAEPPHGRRVLAFTTAGRHGASGGATVVLLRDADSRSRG